MIIKGMTEPFPAAETIDVCGHEYQVMVDAGRLYLVNLLTDRYTTITHGHERLEMFGDAFEAVPVSSSETATH